MEIKDCESYLINLKKDYGRLLFSYDIIEIFKTKIFEGNDCNKLNDTGHLKNILKLKDYTKSAKKTKKLLFEHFLTTSSAKYIMVFEDDAYLHIDLFDNNKKLKLFARLNEFIQKNSPRLLYFGTSRHFTSENLDTDNIKFVSFNEQFSGKPDMCSGAYGFILRRDMIPIVLMRILNKTLDDNPFDLFCLSYLGKVYPRECWVTNPHIVVPNIEGSNIRDGYSQTIVWDSLKTKKSFYNTEKELGVLFVTGIELLSHDDSKYFKKMVSCLSPIIRIIWHKKRNEDILDNYKFIIECDSTIEIKYNSGKTIVDTIIEKQSNCKYLTIFKLDQQEYSVFKIEYLNCLINFEKCQLDI
jgi:hypothetical protein